MTFRTVKESIFEFQLSRPLIKVLVNLCVFGMPYLVAASTYQEFVLSQGPLAYYRFNDSTSDVAINNGMLGSAADGNYVEVKNSQAGPRSPSFPGFESDNTA